MRLLLLALLLSTFCADVIYSASTYVIVRTDGSTFEALSPPEYLDGIAVVTLTGGSTMKMPEKDIDKAATLRANVAGARKDVPSNVVTNDSLSSPATANPELPSARIVRQIEEQRVAIQALCGEDRKDAVDAARQRLVVYFKLHWDEVTEGDIVALADKKRLDLDTERNTFDSFQSYLSVADAASDRYNPRHEKARRAVDRFRTELRKMILADAACGGSVAMDTTPRSEEKDVPCRPLADVTLPRDFRVGRYVGLPGLEGDAEIIIRFAICPGESAAEACRKCVEVYGTAFKAVDCLAFDAARLVASDGCWTARATRGLDGQMLELSNTARGPNCR